MQDIWRDCIEPQERQKCIQYLKSVYFSNYEM